MSSPVFPSAGVGGGDGFPAVSLPTRRRRAAAPNARPSLPATAPIPAAAPTPAAPAAPAPAAQPKHRPGSFPALGLSPALCGALAKKGYGFPTPIQRRVIPAVLAGRDVVAMARTGSGKTAAFLAPVLHRLAAAPPGLAAATRRNGPRALVIAPTRELALQTLRFYKAYGREMGPAVRATVLVGGTPLEAQFEALAVCPELVIATPGRLLQMLAEMGVKGGLTLAGVEMLVLDEADRLFEGTLAPETRAVIDQLTPETEVNSPDRQTVLVSATMPRALADFTRTCLRANVEVQRLDAEKTLSPTLAMGFAVTRSGDEKVASLITVARRILEDDEERSMVVFAATHRAVEYLLQVLRAVLPSVGIVCVHGNLDQGARVEAVAQFRKKEARVLIVTDVAARGIDLPDLDVVVNFDVAPAPKLFVHRVGRVGRAGRPGVALNLVSADEMPYVIDTLLFLARGVTLAKADVGEAGDAWSQHAVAMATTFLIGGMPKSCVDDDMEMLSRLIGSRIEIEKLRKSSSNAHGLYVKTRALASGESVRRAKRLYDDGNGGTVNLPVHPWFANMESAEERTARAHAAVLSTWRPKELAVNAPRVLKRRMHEEEDAEGDGVESESGDNNDTPGSPRLKIVPQPKAKRKKLNPRQAAIEAQRAQFYIPLRRGDGELRNEQAFQLGRDGSRVGGDADGLHAFRAVQAATMDLVADTNTDMRRDTKQSMFWDRVSKKFVKGGVTDKTSKQNVHVATREARARASGGTSMAAYGTADGTMFKAWLNKNRKVIDQMREAGDVSGGQSDGLGSQDFRKGAFGRRSRIAALSAKKGDGVSDGGGGLAKRTANGSGFRSARPELKPTAQIKKERKIKQKTEARRLAKSKGRGRQTGPAGGGAPTRSKTLVYKNGKR